MLSIPIIFGFIFVGICVLIGQLISKVEKLSEEFEEFKNKTKNKEHELISEINSIRQFLINR